MRILKFKPWVYNKCFQNGHVDIEDDKRTGCPTTSTTEENVDKVKDIVFSNH